MTGGVVFGHGKRQRQGRAPERIFDAYLHGDFEVLSRHSSIASTERPTTAARAEAREQIGEIDVVERGLFGTAAGVLARPIGRRTKFLALGTGAERVIRGALLG